MSAKQISWEVDEIKEILRAFYFEVSHRMYIAINFKQLNDDVIYGELIHADSGPWIIYIIKSRHLILERHSTFKPMIAQKRGFRDVTPERGTLDISPNTYFRLLAASNIDLSEYLFHPIEQIRNAAAKVINE